MVLFFRIVRRAAGNHCVMLSYATKTDFGCNEKRIIVACLQVCAVKLGEVRENTSCETVQDAGRKRASHY